jgi:hypothetical protein
MSTSPCSLQLRYHSRRLEAIVPRDFPTITNLFVDEIAEKKCFQQCNDRFDVINPRLNIKQLREACLSPLGVNWAL